MYVNIPSGYLLSKKLLTSSIVRDVLAICIQHVLVVSLGHYNQWYFCICRVSSVFYPVRRQQPSIATRKRAWKSRIFDLCCIYDELFDFFL